MLVTDAYGGHGGIALYNRDLIEAFSGMDEVSRIDVVPRVKRFEVEEVPTKVRFFQNAIGSRARFLLTAIRLAFSRPHLIVCSHINFLKIAMLLGFLTRRPVVLVVYGIDVWKTHGAITQRLVKHVARVWSISEITRDKMNAWAKLPLDRYEILPNAIHLERYGEGPRDVELLKRNAIPADAKLLLTVARLSSAERYKGIDEVLAVMPALIEKFPDLHYVVAGDGDDMPRLKEVAESHGVVHRVRFVGFVTEQEKLAWLRSASVFVMPGRGEGFGFVFLEALACGTPCVGSLLDGSREALRGGELGELVDSARLDTVLLSIEASVARIRNIPETLSYFSFKRFVSRARQALSLVTMERTQDGKSKLHVE